MPDFERHLYDFLFNGERARMMQKIVQHRLQSIIVTQLTQIEEQLSHLDEPISLLENTIAESELKCAKIEAKLEGVLYRADKELRHFKDMYKAEIELMTADIKRLDKKIFKKIDEKTDEFLGKGVHNVIREGEKWAKEELQPFIQQEMRKGITSIIKDKQMRIKELIDGYLITILDDYMNILQDPYLEVPKTKSTEHYLTVLGDTSLGLGAGTAVLGIATLITHHTITNFVSLFTPLAVIVIPFTLFQLWRSLSKIRENIRQEMKDKLYPKIEDALEEVAENVKDDFLSKLPKLAMRLTEEVTAPFEDIKAELSNRQENLKQLLAEKKSQTFDIEQKRKSLTQAQVAFEEVMQKIVNLG